MMSGGKLAKKIGFKSQTCWLERFCFEFEGKSSGLRLIRWQKYKLCSFSPFVTENGRIGGVKCENQEDFYYPKP